MFVNKTPGLTQIASNWIIVANLVNIGADLRYCGQFSKYSGQSDPLIIGADSRHIVADFLNFC